MEKSVGGGEVGRKRCRKIYIILHIKKARNHHKLIVWKLIEMKIARVGAKNTSKSTRRIRREKWKMRKLNRLKSEGNFVGCSAVYMCQIEDGRYERGPKGVRNLLSLTQKIISVLTAFQLSEISHSTFHSLMLIELNRTASEHSWKSTAADSALKFKRYPTENQSRRTDKKYPTNIFGRTTTNNSILYQSRFEFNTECVTILLYRYIDDDCDSAEKWISGPRKKAYFHFDSPLLLSSPFNRSTQSAPCDRLRLKKIIK